jgi:RHS repeat-associated protein
VKLGTFAVLQCSFEYGDAILAVSYTYDVADRRTSLTLPNGVVTAYSYDAASRLVGLSYNNAATTLGNLTYSYDAAGRLINTGGSLARTNLPQAVSTTSYNSANQQTGFGAQTLTYDLNGNLTSDGVNSYTWNARDQLVAISGTGLSASFAYDAAGRRVSKTINSVTTSYLFDGVDVVQEQLGGTASANILMKSIDEVFSRTDSTGTWNPLSDLLGSTIVLTDATGTAQTQYSYEPFGKATASGPASSNPSKYTGREDDTTGLDYYRARYYSPSLQRFISEDPLGFGAGDSNFYVYVHNKPTTLIDPRGRDDFDNPREGPNQNSIDYADRVYERLNQEYLQSPYGRKGRSPDYYAFNWCIGGTIGYSGQVVVDRNGNWYIAPYGVSGGISTTWISLSLTAGKLAQDKKPSPQELYDFLEGHSIFGGGGYICGGGVTTSIVGGKPKTAIELGLFTPQAGSTYVYDFPIHDRPKK